MYLYRHKPQTRYIDVNVQQSMTRTFWCHCIQNQQIFLPCGGTGQQTKWIHVDNVYKSCSSLTVNKARLSLMVHPEPPQMLKLFLLGAFTLLLMGALGLYILSWE